MSLRRFVALPLLLIGLIGGCDAGQDTLSDADRTALAQLREGFIQATLARDFDRILATRTEDIVWMPPNAPIVSGKSEVRQWLEAGPRAVGFELTPTRLEGDDDLAFERGRFVYRALMGADTVTDAGKYLVILRRQADGAWLLAVEMWNSDAPPPSVSPAPATRRQ
jgi:ketosteroid isomerase-like protein